MLYIGNWKDTKKEEIDGEVIELGSRLVKYIPTAHININIENGGDNGGQIYSVAECVKIANKAKKAIDSNGVVDLCETKFKNALFDFYTKCIEDIRIYNEDNFLAYFNHIGFSLPQNHITILSDNIDELLSPLELPCNKHITQTCYKTDIDTIDYYMAVAYELIKHKYTVNKCVECGNWFIAYNKVDTIYCVDCGKKRDKIRTNICDLRRKIKNNCKKNYSNTKLCAISMEIDAKQPDTKTATYEELEKYHSYLLKTIKDNFPRANRSNKAL